MPSRQFPQCEATSLRRRCPYISEQAAHTPHWQAICPPTTPPNCASIGCARKCFPARGKPAFCSASGGTATKKQGGRNRAGSHCATAPAYCGSVPYPTAYCISAGPTASYLFFCYSSGTKIVQIESKSKSKLVLTFSFVEMQPILREAKVPKGERKTKQKLTKPPKAVVIGYWLLVIDSESASTSIPCNKKLKDYSCMRKGSCRYAT